MSNAGRRALKQLGITHIPAYSRRSAGAPSEFGTCRKARDELRLSDHRHGGGHRYLREVYLERHMHVSKAESETSAHSDRRIDIDK